MAMTAIAMRCRRSALLGGAASLLFSAVPAWALTDHPLDALTANEITQAVTLLRENGYVDEQTRYPLINLLEPSKDDVLVWEPGDPLDRRASLVIKKGAQTYEAVVNLTDKVIDQWQLIESVQPNFLVEDWAVAQELTLANPDWQASMRARGYDTFENIYCEALSAGYFALKEEEGRRLIKMPCFDTARTGSDYHAHPIEGLYTVVDVNARDVIEVIDTGAVPVNSQVYALREGARSNSRRSIKRHAADMKVATEDNRILWDAWSFHLRFDGRVGPVLSLISYADKRRVRSVMYQGSISEVFVPYMDSDAGWSYRSFLDVGEFGFGRTASTLVAGTDCPENAQFLDAILPADNGTPYERRDVICVFERNTDAPLWRHFDYLKGTYAGRPAVELVVRSISTLSNYDYVVDWVFTQGGEIRVDVGATGIDTVKGVFTEALRGSMTRDDTAYGALVAPNLVAVNHDHYLSFRFDLDIDGPKNSFVRERLAVQELPPNNPRRSLWALDRVPAETEAAIPALHVPEVWRVANPNVETALGYNPSFQIVPGHTTTSVLNAEDWPQRRAAFSAETLWITVYEPSELYAAGPYPNQSRGGEGLPAYIDGQEIENADVVVWYTMGFHHVTRPEDWPILPTRWHSVSLRPHGFFTENPSVDVPNSTKSRRVLAN